MARCESERNIVTIAKVGKIRLVPHYANRNSTINFVERGNLQPELLTVRIKNGENGVCETGNFNVDNRTQQPI